MFFSCKKSVQKTVPNANVLTLRLLYTTDRNGIVHSVLFEATATSALITALNHILIKSYSAFSVLWFFALHSIVLF